MLAVGTEVAGYRIEGLLGRGAMGAVYHATQLSLGRAVAFKVLTAGLSEDSVFRERFRREGRIQAQIDHPHIVTVHEAGESEVGLYIAMRMIRGPTLKAVIAAGELDLGKTLHLLGSVGEALDAAHEAGLLHRDIKPQNILIERGDHAYLADFGVAKDSSESALTHVGHFMGTAAYVAPEIVEGKGATAASDVYALAAVLFECLTGSPPFVYPSYHAVLHAQVNEPPPLVSLVRPGLPVALDGVLQAGLAKTPPDRPATASALIDAARDAAAEQQTTAVAVAPVVPEAGGTVATTALPTPDTTLPAPPPASAPSRAPATPAPAARRAGPSRRAIAGALGVAGVIAALAITVGGGGGEESPRARPAAVLGSALPPVEQLHHCFGGGANENDPCTLVQTRLPGPGGLDSPLDGVITRWRTRGARGRLRLVTVRAEGDRSNFAGGAGWVTAKGGKEVGEYDSRLQISKGERVGVEFARGAQIGSHYLEGAGSQRWGPALAADDEARRPDYDDVDGLELLLNADVERDADGDGFGDATQDACPRDKARHAGC